MFLQHGSMAFKIIEFKKKDSLEMLKDLSKEALKMCNMNIGNDRDFFWCEDPEKYWPSWRR